MPVVRPLATLDLEGCVFLNVFIIAVWSSNGANSQEWHRMGFSYFSLFLEVLISFGVFLDD